MSITDDPHGGLFLAELQALWATAKEPLLGVGDALTLSRIWSRGPEVLRCGSVEMLVNHTSGVAAGRRSHIKHNMAT